MTTRHHVYGAAFGLVLWDDTDPPSGVGPFHYVLGLRAVRERFIPAGGRVVGLVNDIHPLLVDADAPTAAVHAVEGDGDAAALCQVADSCTQLDAIAELLAMLWEAHAGAVTLPFDPAYRATATDVLREIAAHNPGSDVGFWRAQYLRQYDLRISV